MTELAIEASDLGLAPGQWPTVITYENRDFICARFNRCEGELMDVEYIAEDGTAVLSVYND